MIDIQFRDYGRVAYASAAIYPELQQAEPVKLFGAIFIIRENKQACKAALHKNKRNIMSDSYRNNSQSKSPDSPGNSLVDWGAVLELMSDKLQSYTSELSKHKRKISKVIKNKYFSFETTGQEPTIEALGNVADALGGLQGGIDHVVRRFDLFGAKAFREIADGLIRDRREKKDHDEVDPDDYFDLDE